MSSFQYLDCPTPGSAVNDEIKWHMRWLLECSSVDKCHVWLRFTGHRKPTRVAPLLSMAPPWNRWVPVRFQDCLPTLPNEPSELERSREEEASRCLSRGGGECECSRSLRVHFPPFFDPSGVSLSEPFELFLQNIESGLENESYSHIIHQSLAFVQIVQICPFLFNQPGLNYLLSFYSYLT